MLDVLLESLERLVDEDPVLREAADSMAKASTPEPFSTSKTSNWVARGGGLPPYIQHIAHAIERDGKDRSKAIAIAIGTVKRWALGGGNVDAGTKAAAAKALAQWEKLKAGAKAKRVAREAALTESVAVRRHTRVVNGRVQIVKGFTRKGNARSLHTVSLRSPAEHPDTPKSPPKLPSQIGGRGNVHLPGTKISVPRDRIDAMQASPSTQRAIDARREHLATRRTGKPRVAPKAPPPPKKRVRVVAAKASGISAEQRGELLDVMFDASAKKAAKREALAQLGSQPDLASWPHGDLSDLADAADEHGEKALAQFADAARAKLRAPKEAHDRDVQGRAHAPAPKAKPKGVSPRRGDRVEIHGGYDDLPDGTVGTVLLADGEGPGLMGQSMVRATDQDGKSVSVTLPNKHLTVKAAAKAAPAAKPKAAATPKAAGPEDHAMKLLGYKSDTARSKYLAKLSDQEVSDLASWGSQRSMATFGAVRTAVSAEQRRREPAPEASTQHRVKVKLKDGTTREVVTSTTGPNRENQARSNAIAKGIEQGWDVTGETHIKGVDDAPKPKAKTAPINDFDTKVPGLHVVTYGQEKKGLVYGARDSGHAMQLATAALGKRPHVGESAHGAGPGSIAHEERAKSYGWPVLHGQGAAGSAPVAPSRPMVDVPTPTGDPKRDLSAAKAALKAHTTSRPATGSGDLVAHYRREDELRSAVRTHVDAANAAKRAALPPPAPRAKKGDAGQAADPAKHKRFADTPRVLGQLKRGNIVTVKGRKGEMMVLKRSGNDVWVRPHTGDRLASRPLGDDHWDHERGFRHKLDDLVTYKARR